MADITKCTSMNCPYRNSCYRALAVENNNYQSWTNFEYTCNEVSGFENFIPMDDRK
jgi:hypothetical protein